MRIADIIEYVDALPGVLTQRPQPGDGTPPISWGDVFFYYAPNGEIPKSQPFATIVTKDYPDDQTSRLERPDTFRVNISATATEFREVTGHDRRTQQVGDADPSTPDVLVAHPVYGHLTWLAVVNPGERTSVKVLDLLALAHQAARARYERRTEGAAQ